MPHQCSPLPPTSTSHSAQCTEFERISCRLTSAHQPVTPADCVMLGIVLARAHCVTSHTRGAVPCTPEDSTTLATATPYSSAGGGEAGEDLVTVFPLSLSTLSVESHLIVGAAGGAGDEDCSACCAKLFAICNTESFLGFAPSPASGAAAGICGICGSGTGAGAGAGGWLGAACTLIPGGACLCTDSGAASCGTSAGAATLGVRLASPSVT